MKARRLAIVTSHPIQYYAPWFRHLAAREGLEIRVFYLWDFGVRAQVDPGFGHAVRWDVPLLDGYAHEFVPNTSDHPGTERFSGLRNPTLAARLKAFAPDAALLLCYRYDSTMRLIFTPRAGRPYPLLFRGDSHRLFVPPQPAWKRWGRRAAISLVFRRFAAVLYVGQANREYFRLHGVPPERLFFAPHCVDNDRFQADPERVRRAAREWRRSLGVPEENALVLFAGKFEDKKRPLDLLAAFRHAGLPGVSLLFVGAGGLEETLRASARDVPGVFFAPFQNQSFMPRAYAAADLFVLPSYGPEETWGLAVNEAMCMGKAVIVSTHVGCGPDLVRPGENGFVFTAGDVDALAGALGDALVGNMAGGLWAAGERSRALVAAYCYASATDGLCQALASLKSTRP